MKGPNQIEDASSIPLLNAIISQDMKEQIFEFWENLNSGAIVGVT